MIRMSYLNCVHRLVICLHFLLIGAHRLPNSADGLLFHSLGLANHLHRFSHIFCHMTNTSCALPFFSTPLSFSSRLPLFCAYISTSDSPFSFLPVLLLSVSLNQLTSPNLRSLPPLIPTCMVALTVLSWRRQWQQLLMF